MQITGASALLFLLSANKCNINFYIDDLRYFVVLSLFYLSLDTTVSGVDVVDNGGVGRRFLN